jgi:hypothetical protein
MAVINDANVAANIAQVAPVSTLTVQFPLRAMLSAIPHGNLGHYRVSHRCLLAAAQAAGSRIFEFRNTHASNIIVPTRLVVRWIQSAAGTAQDNGLDIFRDTAFSAVDTTNTVTPTVIPKRSGMAAAPGGAAVRGVTSTGVAAGMTGGTRTPDATPFCQVPLAVLAAAQSVVNMVDCLDDVNGTHPFGWTQNEGLEIQNRVLNVTSYGIMVYVDMSWAEVTLY